MEDQQQDAVIVLSRKQWSWRDGLRGYAVMIDGKQVAKVRRGQTVDVRIAPGRHEIFLQISWCRSPSIQVDAHSGEVIKMYCQPGGPVDSALRDTLGNANAYINLTRI